MKRKFLYHGTDSFSAHFIKQEGLKPESWFVKSPGRARMFGSKVFRVAVEDLDSEALTPQKFGTLTYSELIPPESLRLV